MKKILMALSLCAALFVSTQAKAAGCYVTATNDYICDTVAPTTAGQTVQRTPLANVPGSNNVFQTNNIRSQYSWMPGVLVNLGINTSSPPPGTHSTPNITGGTGGTASGTQTAQWSGAECTPGEDPRVAAQNLLIQEERRMMRSYYDGQGGHGSCPGSNCVCPAAYKPQNACHLTVPRGCNYPYCGTNSAGCLTVGIGHLVLPHEVSTYLPCGTTFSDDHINNLFINVDFPPRWNSAVSQTQQMCLSGEEASCFLVTLTSVIWQLGAGWYNRTTYTGNTWAALRAGQFRVAASRFSSSPYCGQYSHRCGQFVAAINALDAQGVTGCDGVANN